MVSRVLKKVVVSGCSIITFILLEIETCIWINKIELHINEIELYLGQFIKQSFVESNTQIVHKTMV